MMTRTGRSAGSVRSAESKPLDLAGRRLGKVVYERDPARRLVPGQPIRDVTPKLVSQRVTRVRARLQHAHRSWLREAVVVLAPDDGSLEDRGMLHEARFHLG